MFLVVDDSMIVRYAVRQALHMHQLADTIEACDGTEGYRKFIENEKTIDFCIFDVNMPNMDGITLTGEVRRRNPNVPIVIMTTESDKNKMKKARDLGANGWIIKPFDAEKFIGLIRMMTETETPVYSIRINP